MRTRKKKKDMRGKKTQSRLRSVNSNYLFLTLTCTMSDGDCRCPWPGIFWSRMCRYKPMMKYVSLCRALNRIFLLYKLWGDGNYICSKPKILISVFEMRGLFHFHAWHFSDKQIFHCETRHFKSKHKCKCQSLAKGTEAGYYMRTCVFLTC